MDKAFYCAFILALETHQSIDTSAPIHICGKAVFLQGKYSDRGEATNSEQQPLWIRECASSILSPHCRELYSVSVLTSDDEKRGKRACLQQGLLCEKPQLAPRWLFFVLPPEAK